MSSPISSSTSNLSNSTSFASSSSSSINTTVNTNSSIALQTYKAVKEFLEKQTPEIQVKDLEWLRNNYSITYNLYKAGESEFEKLQAQLLEFRQKIAEKRSNKGVSLA